MQTFSIGTANPVCEFDQVIVRNFVSTEPSYNSAGAEESNGGGSAQNPLYMIKNI